MENYFVSSGYISRDFYVMQYGQQQCDPGYGFGPCIRNNYFLHYIVSGKGAFTFGGKTLPLKAGMAFLIRPGQLTYYEADSAEPWHYRWIEFGGENCELLLTRAGLAGENQLFTDRDGLLSSAMEQLLSLKSGATDEEVMSAGWRVAAALTKGYREDNRQTAPDYHLRRAVAYIQSRIHKRIMVSDVAEYVGVDRSYLGRLFSRYKGMSTQQFIINTKMEAAAQFLLLNPSLSINEIARSSGYDDQLDFSKAFKSRYGMSPTQWRKSQLWEHSIKK